MEKCTSDNDYKLQKVSDAPGKGSFKDVLFEPFPLFLVIIVCIFLSEFVIMQLIVFIPELSIYNKAVVDSALLTIVLLPFLYVLLYLPYNAHVREKRKANERLLYQQENLRNLASHISTIEEKERRQIALDLHDGIGQLLATSKIKMRMLRSSLSSAEQEKAVDEVIELIDESIQGTRNLTVELSPPTFNNLGLGPAVAWLADNYYKKHGLKVTLKEDGESKPVGDEVKSFLFQSVRELLFNVVKHARVDKASVSTVCDENRIRVVVEDAGAGIRDVSVSDEVSRSDAYGLFSVKERVKDMGGSFDLQSYPGKGTKVVLQVPV